MALLEHGLWEYCDYRGQQVEVQHKNGNWYPLVRTAAKVLYYEDEGEHGKVVQRKMRLDSLSGVNFINGSADPVSLESPKEKEKPAEPLGNTGLYTHNDYSDQGLEVQHIDKGWFPLVRTAAKVIYYNEDGKVRRMSLSKLGGVREAQAQSEFELDSFFEYDLVG